MKVLHVRNVHDALPRALSLLAQEGVARDSRNGPVRMMPCPVSTVYEKPTERVIFWPERDANPFFHLYESLWMLAGRNDVAPLTRYAKNMANYSDDGLTLHDAYGYRWRHYRRNGEGVLPLRGDGFDQLPEIARSLRQSPDDRRAVVAMWNADTDLGRNGKAVPCNLTATFQRGTDGALNMVVFCRSNDIIWGAYGANAVQFSFLQEYLATWINCPIGTYTQISVNWHGYLTTLEPLQNLRPDRANYVNNPYLLFGVYPISMCGDGDIAQIDNHIKMLLWEADRGFPYSRSGPDPITAPWAAMVHTVLKAHHVYLQKNTGSRRFFDAVNVLHAFPQQNADWIVAAKQWIERRHDAWREKYGSTV